MTNHQCTRLILKKSTHLFIALTLLVSSAHSLALGEKTWLSKGKNTADLQLVSQQQQAQIYVDAADFSGVARATKNLQSDIEKVSGKKLALLNQFSTANDKTSIDNAVIIGTLDHSALIAELIAAKKIDVSGIKDQWDAYQVQVVQQPTAHIKRALVIVGANKRGTSYGIYSLSQQIGVSPWYWWADVPVKQKSEIFIAHNTKVIEIPKVKYRGIFLNDEAPALTNWVTEKYGNYNAKFYENVFELLLRLKANFLWPAMWNNAFADDDPQNMILADDYGIVMSTSHHEPMMRADKEWNRYGEGPWEYSKNPENLYKFWQAGAERNKPYESIYTLGMRGQADTPMSEGENISLLEKVVKDQRQILSDVFGKDKVHEVPQVWALYKEVQGFYERGMRVPDDVILLWCDDNWGNIRRLPTPAERTRSGGAGVYYHFDYVGGPRSYRWINTITIAKIWEQMQLAYAYDANKIWLVNVGDLKPMEYPIEFFLNMAWNPEAWPKERIPEFGKLWAEREFGAQHANDIAQIMTGYTRHNLRRKPELLDATTYSQVNYREAERVTANINALAEKAEKIYQQLPAEMRPAFYQLVLFPTQASANLTAMYNAQAKNQLYANQGRASSQDYAQQVKSLFAHDEELTQEYHSLLNGKWNHMMSQPHIGYSYWNNPAANTMPLTYDYVPHAHAEMGIAIEGQSNAWPTPGDYELPRFDPYGQQQRTIEIFNKGKESFTATAQTSAPWIILSHTSIQVKQEAQIKVSIDWRKAPKGMASGSIQISGPSWGSASITLSSFNPEVKNTKVKGFVEADGYIALEAADYARQQAAGNLRWEEIPEHGRSRSSMSVYPLTDTHFETAAGAPYLEYAFYSFSTGEWQLDAQFAPSWPFFPKQSLRYGISIDDAPVQIVDLTADMSSATWDETVRSDIRQSFSTHQVNTIGPHKLRVYSLDPGLSLERLIINTGGLAPSYLGPPASPKR